jgi:hypothetical protein
MEVVEERFKEAKEERLKAKADREQELSEANAKKERLSVVYKQKQSDRALEAKAARE